MDPHQDLAKYVREACEHEGLTAFAKRLGLHKNYVFRAGHPGEKAPSGREYNPPLSWQTRTLLKALGLTIAPVQPTPAEIWQITTLIDRMDAPEAAKKVAKAAVHAAGLAAGEEA